MNDRIAWIAAEADEMGIVPDAGLPKRKEEERSEEMPQLEGLRAHNFPASVPTWEGGYHTFGPESTEEIDREKQRRTYRGRTVAMLRRYLRYSIETGRLPSILGQEFFRAKVTSYTVVTFEDRVIFAHDMEKCLQKLDAFSQQLIARHIMQEHDQLATSRLLNCSERTVRTFVPIALDLLSEILVDVGLLERIESNRENSCQGGPESENSVSDCEDGKYKC